MTQAIRAIFDGVAALPPALLVLVGTALGVLGSALPSLIAAKAESERQRRRLAFELGLKEWEITFQATVREAERLNKTVVTLPPALYVFNAMRVAEQLDKGRLTADTLKRIHDEQDKLEAVLYELRARSGSRAS